MHGTWIHPGRRGINVACDRSFGAELSRPSGNDGGAVRRRGPTDTVARLIAEPMTASLGQQVIVENVGGAGGTLGAARVAKAEPDGYTLLLHHIGQATSASLYRKLPYKPGEAFAAWGW